MYEFRRQPVRLFHYIVTHFSLYWVIVTICYLLWVSIRCFEKTDSYLTWCYCPMLGSPKTLNCQHREFFLGQTEWPQTMSDTLPPGLPRANSPWQGCSTCWSLPRVAYCPWQDLSNCWSPWGEQSPHCFTFDTHIVPGGFRQGCKDWKGKHPQGHTPYDMGRTRCWRRKNQ